MLPDIIWISPADSSLRRAAESNRQKAKTWVQVNQEEHLPGDRQKFKFSKVWVGRMKRRMQLMQLKQISMAHAKEGTRTAISCFFFF